MALRYPCHFDYDDEKSKHERSCPSRIISCCQNSVSCQRKVKHWLEQAPCAENEAKKKVTLVLCKHNSNGLFGAMREDNLDLVAYFLRELKDNLVQALTHESKFGDTIVTFASSLGRTAIVKVLVNTMKSIVYQSKTLALSDLVDYETSRGKTPMVQAVKHNNAGVVSILLSHRANVKVLTKTHRKSALDWAALGNESILKMIQEHTQLEEHVCLLFKAISNCNFDRVQQLTEGGAPFQQNQDVTFGRELKTKRHRVAMAKQKMSELSAALSLVEDLKAKTHREIQERTQCINCILQKQQDIVSNRKKAITTAIAKVRLAFTPTNITNVCNITAPPREYELLSKSLASLLHIKVKKGSEEAPWVYWREIKGLLQNHGRFYHRMYHYSVCPSEVKMAAKVRIEELPGTLMDHLSSMLHLHHEQSKLGSVIIASIAHWLWTIFQSLSGYKLEKDLNIKESVESDILDRGKIEHDVLASRSVILKRELDHIRIEYESKNKQISQLQRKLEMSKVMAFVSCGHSILSVAARTGNENMLKLLLKRGAHTAVGEDCLAWCAMIIQVFFRYHFKRKRCASAPHDATSIQENNERREHDFAVSLRIRSLSNLIRERLKSLHLPLAEALFNGHLPNIALILDGSDMSLFQSFRLFHLFHHQPSAMIPRLNTPRETLNRCLPEFLLSLLPAGQRYCHEKDPNKCAFVCTLKCIIDLYGNFLAQQKNRMEEKIRTRRRTIMRQHNDAMISKMRSAVYRGDFEDMVKTAEEGGISLDWEDATSGITPLIRSALLPDVHSAVHEWLKNLAGEPVTAAAFLLDGISPHRPSVDYENRHGYTALMMACMNGRLEIIKDLLDRGADILRQSRLLRCTAYGLAVQEKQLDVVKILEGRLGGEHTALLVQRGAVGGGGQGELCA